MSLDDYSKRDKSNKRGRDGHSGGGGGRRHSDAGGRDGDGVRRGGNSDRGGGGGSSGGHGQRRHSDGGGGGGYGQRRQSGGGGHGGGGGPTPAGERLDEEGYLWFDKESGKCTYFQDRRRKWPFYTGEAGKDHLCALVAANSALRKHNLALLSAAGENPDRVRAEGERIYVEKPTLRGDAKITWSFEEYGHPGLQLYYLKLKAWQRFTET